MITLTAVSHCLRPGDIVSVQLPLTKWERFLIWLARPWRWPPRCYQSNLVIDLVVGRSSVEENWA